MGGGTQPSSTPRQIFRRCLITAVVEREDPRAVEEMNLMNCRAVPWVIALPEGIGQASGRGQKSTLKNLIFNGKVDAGQGD